MSKIRTMVLLVLVVALVAGCSGIGRLPRWHLPRRGPVDVFEDLIGQVKQIGQSVARQFGGMGGARR
jgi:hypothetical protein